MARQGVQLNLEEGPTVVEVCAGQGLGKLVAVGKVLFPFARERWLLHHLLPACGVLGFACNQLLWRNHARATLAWLTALASVLRHMLCCAVLCCAVLCCSQDDDERDVLREIISNSKLSEHFLALARDLDVMEPKVPEDVYKTHLTGVCIY